MKTTDAVKTQFKGKCSKGDCSFQRKPNPLCIKRTNLGCVLIRHKRSRGRHRFHGSTFLEKHDKHLFKFYSHWTEPKLGVAMHMSKHTPNVGPKAICMSDQGNH
jgi:hypothetical protein